MTATPNAVLGLITDRAFCADPNPRDLVSQSITNYDKDWQAALDFTHTEREVTKDSSGHPKTVELSQVNVFDGGPCSLLIAKQSVSTEPRTGSSCGSHSPSVHVNAID